MSLSLSDSTDLLPADGTPEQVVDLMAGPHRPQLAVSTAVFRNSKVLLASRMAAPSKGLFSLPGGRVEYGETLEEAAHRELAEEVGVRATILGFADHVEIRDVDEGGVLRFHGFVCVFAALWESGEPQTGPEAGEIVWADAVTLARLPTTVRLAEVVAKSAAIVEAYAALPIADATEAGL